MCTELSDTGRIYVDRYGALRPYLPTHLRLPLGIACYAELNRIFKLSIRDLGGQQKGMCDSVRFLGELYAWMKTAEGVPALREPC